MIIKLVARICKSNSICHYIDKEYIYVNKEQIVSIAPNNTSTYTLVLTSGETFVIDMSDTEIEKALEE